MKTESVVMVKIHQLCFFLAMKRARRVQCFHPEYLPPLFPATGTDPHSLFFKKGVCMCMCVGVSYHSYQTSHSLL